MSDERPDTIKPLTRLMRGVLYPGAALVLPLLLLFFVTVRTDSLAAQPEATPRVSIPYIDWTFEEIAPASSPHALALDANDHPHVLYQDSQTRAIHYATRDGDAASPGEWHLEEVAPGLSRDASYSFDIAIRPDGAPCLVYAVTSLELVYDTKLVYGCRGPEEWNLAEIDDGGDGAQLLFDDGGTPHIALEQGESVVYITRLGENWWGWVVDTFDDYMALKSLALNSSGRPHLVYEGYHGTFVSVREASGLWMTSRIDTDDLQSPRLDTADRLWGVVIGFLDVGGRPPMIIDQLFLARPNAAGGHDLEMVEQEFGGNYMFDLVMAGDAPHLAYKGFQGQLGYVWWTAAGLQRHNPPAIADGEVSLALGSDGQPRLVYYHDDALYLATRRTLFHDESLVLPFVAADIGVLP